MEKSISEDLVEAAKNNDVVLIKALIDNGIDVNKPSSDGRNALCIAARLGHIDVLQVLLGVDCKVDIVDQSDDIWGRQPIHQAASKGHQV